MRFRRFGPIINFPNEFPFMDFLFVAPLHYDLPELMMWHRKIN